MRNTDGDISVAIIISRRLVILPYRDMYMHIFFVPLIFFANGLVGRVNRRWPS